MEVGGGGGAMPSIFDRVEESVHELAAIITIVLGIAMLTSGSWALHETLDSESRVYFIIGYMSGTKHYPAKVLLEELNQRLSPYIQLLKACFSIAILLGLLQIAGGLLGFKWGNVRQIQIGWLISLTLETALSITSCAAPIAVGLRGFLELQVVTVVAGVNAFVLLHVVGVLAFKLRDDIRDSNLASSSSSTSSSTNSTPSTARTATTSITMENPIAVNSTQGANTSPGNTT